MVISSQRTLYNVDLHLSMLLGRDYMTKPNTTLNEKFDVLADVNGPEGMYPKLQYYCIGIGGDQLSESVSGFPVSEHSPMDAALFEQIPFVIRPIQQDLTPTERANYRFRVIETIKNETYVCYYLKVIPGYTLRDDFYKVTTVNGLSTLKLMDTDNPEFLNPVPRNRRLNYDNMNTTEFITKIAKLEFNLMHNDIKELENVLNILGKDGRQLTEIGVCTGIDNIIDGNVEASSVQIAFHLGVNLDLVQSINVDNNIIRVIEIGGSEGLTFGNPKNG